MRSLLLVPIAAVTLVLCGSADAAIGWEDLPAILARIKTPVFPDRDFDVTKFGARGDGATDCRKAIGEAIDACAKAGGGRVVVPAGHYVCNGPIHLRSNVNLHVAKAAAILFGTNPDDYLVGDAAHAGCVLVMWEGTRCYNYSPLIYAFQQSNIAVTGEGTLDGQCGKGWAAWRKQQGPAQKKMREMNHAGVPVEQRIFGKGNFIRPALLEPYECTGVLIEGVTVKDSPFWTIHPTRCANVTVRGVTSTGNTWNDDGCNPESCTDVLIEGCTFDTRDDNIAIKAGRDNDGWAANGGRPCENIIIRNCHFRRGAPGGVSVGSEMSGDVRNVFVEKCTMGRVERPFCLKANPDRGGVIENFRAREVRIDECECLLRIEMNYKNQTTGAYPPVFREIHIENVTCTKAKTVFHGVGLPGHPVQKVSLKNVTVASCEVPLKTENVAGLRLDNVKVNGQSVNAP